MTTQTNTHETGTAKRERIEARVTAEQKALLLRAAQLSGRTLTEFMLTSAEAAAEELIRKHQVITLSVADSHVFANALLNPPLPNPKLSATIVRYKEEVTDEL